MKQGKYITSIGNHEEIRNAPLNTIKPVREPSLRSDVITPLAFSSITSFIAFIGIIFFVRWRNGFVNIDTIFGIGFWGCLIWLAVFFWKSGLLQKTFYMVESVAGIDMNHDGVKGEPGHPAVVNNMKDKRVKQATEFEKWRDAFYEFVEYCYNEGITTVALRRKFTDKQIDAYWAYMVRMGIGDWKGKSHKEGRILLVEQDEAEEILNRIEWMEQQQPNI